MRNADATQIRVRSAAVGDGYFPEPGAGQTGRRLFSSRRSRDDRTKRVCALSGALSDVINVAGKKVNPAEVEATC